MDQVFKETQLSFSQERRHFNPIQHFRSMEATIRANIMASKGMDPTIHNMGKAIPKCPSLRSLPNGLMQVKG